MNPIDFASDEKWRHLFYQYPADPTLKEFKRFLRDHQNEFVTLYHGTSETHPVMTQGLLPTSNSRKKSLQSSNGFVCFSVYPGHAYDFGKLAYPSHKIVVYKVTTTIRRIKPDLDQLRNVRMHKHLDVGMTLADSLVYGSGARIKGKVDQMQLTPTEYQRPQLGITEITVDGKHYFGVSTTVT